MKRIIYIAGVVILVAFQVHSVFAADIGAVNQHINDINSQIQALDREIKQYQDQISVTSEQSNTLSNIIKELTLTRDKLLKETKQTEKKITATNIIIGSLGDDIKFKEKSINNSELALTQALREIQTSDNNTFVEKILSKGNLSDANREYNNILSLNEKIRAYIVDIKKQKEALSLSKTKKQGEQQVLSKLKKTLVEKKVAVDVTKKEKDTLLKETKNKESNYKKLLADRIKKRDAFEKDLEKYEAELQFILNPNLLPKEGSGILSWPLDNVYITQLFGRTSASKRLYTSGSHSGVDFRASIGTQVKSMSNGVVIGTGDTDLYCKGASFGKWIFIKYNNGLSSTFGHLSYISTSAGQKVNTGDVVGLSGNTGHSTGPHLHVTVYASQGADVRSIPSLSCNGKTFIMPIAPVNAYLDPILYLPKVIAGMLKNDRPRD
ncbi:MAG: peptidoglycan DD-metalloendopeptidase family protein [Patescibacteria group bacterium]